MKTEIRDKTVRHRSQFQLDESYKVEERWQQFRLVSNGNRRSSRTVAGMIDTNRPARQFDGVQFVWLLSSAITLLIAARIGLKLITTNAGTPLGAFLFDFTDLLLRPFSQVTETISTTHISVLELSALNAIIIYPFAAWCLVKLIQYLFQPSR
jgi:hypothetical protein